MPNDWQSLRDSLRLTIRPIDQWPGNPTRSDRRECSPFRAGLDDTLEKLEREGFPWLSKYGRHLNENNRV